MQEVLQTRNRAFGPNGVPTTSRQTSATRTDTTSRLPISLGSTNKRYEPSTDLRSRPSDPSKTTLGSRIELRIRRRGFVVFIPPARALLVAPAARVWIES